MSYIFRRPVNSGFKETEEMTKWAVQHCPSYIANDVDQTGEWCYRLYFSDEKDYLMFVLRWA
jgi:hypothetical protein